jgi:hypothetical protein
MNFIAHVVQTDGALFKDGFVDLCESCSNFVKQQGPIPHPSEEGMIVSKDVVCLIDDEEAVTCHRCGNTR